MQVFKKWQDSVLQDIGQLSEEDRKELNKLVRKGLVIKTREYWHGWGGLNAGPLKTTYRLRAN